MIKGSVLTAALLIFVDSVKELPATLILRPFNFETLSTTVYGAASLEQLGPGRSRSAGNHRRRPCPGRPCWPAHSTNRGPAIMLVMRVNWWTLSIDTVRDPDGNGSIWR